MFGKMMNRYYYGKSGKGDYTKEDLPQTRWQLFWEMLRVRLSGLIRLNLMYAVAWLPAIFVIGRGLLLWYAGWPTWQTRKCSWRPARSRPRPLQR